MKALFLIFFSLCLTISFAQKGKVEVIKDPKIDALIKQESVIVPPATTPQIGGYRLQLFFDSEKANVDEARSKFMSMYPKIDTYVYYNAPNYFLKVGDFRTQNDAEKVKTNVDGAFPTCFIVKEMINLPRIDQ